MVITPAMARTAMRRCGKVAAEKPVVAEAVSLAEAALPTMIAAGIWSCTHATQPRVTDEQELEYYYEHFFNSGDGEDVSLLLPLVRGIARR